MDVNCAPKCFVSCSPSLAIDVTLYLISFTDTWRLLHDGMHGCRWSSHLALHGVHDGVRLPYRSILDSLRWIPRPKWVVFLHGSLACAADFYYNTCKRNVTSKISGHQLCIWSCSTIDSNNFRWIEPFQADIQLPWSRHLHAEHTHFRVVDALQIRSVRGLVGLSGTLSFKKLPNSVVQQTSSPSDLLCGVFMSVC